jgi:protein-L-isoaspartate(D-aspartate) O-methyltransferase
VKRFEEERLDLVDHLKKRGITDENVLRALSVVERHKFVPEPFTPRSYEDQALPISQEQTISQPYTVALMTQALEVSKGMKVLEIGTGSGYQAAILAEMGGRVFTIERLMDLQVMASRLLERLNYQIASKWGDGTVGWSEFAPYDRIIVTAASPDVPKPLVNQLVDGGKLVVPVGDLDSQSLIVVTKSGDQVTTKEMKGFRFVPLIGKMGWNNSKKTDER